MAPTSLHNADQEWYRRCERDWLQANDVTATELGQITAKYNDGAFPLACNLIGECIAATDFQQNPSSPPAHMSGRGRPRIFLCSWRAPKCPELFLRVAIVRDGTNFTMI